MLFFSLATKAFLTEEVALIHITGLAPSDALCFLREQGDVILYYYNVHT